MLYLLVNYSFVYLVKFIIKFCHLRFIYFVTVCGLYVSSIILRTMSLQILPLVKIPSDSKSDPAGDDSGVFDEMEALNTSINRATHPTPDMDCEEALPAPAPLVRLGHEFFGWRANHITSLLVGFLNIHICDVSLFFLNTMEIYLD